MTQITDKHPQQILILQSAFIGDVILALPLLQETRRLFPNAHIDMLVIPAAANLLETSPLIREIIVYDKRKSDRGASAFFQLMKRLRKKRYDLALVPHRSLRSAALVYGARVAKSIGFNNSAGRSLYSDLVHYYRDGRHEINRNLQLLVPFGYNPTGKVFPELHFSEEDRQIVQRWKNQFLSGSESAYFTMAPGSVWATKRWLPERFAAVASQLSRKGHRVVLIGGPADSEIITHINVETRQALPSAAGVFTLRQSALLIRDSLALITNDSSPLHLAVSTRTPVIAIFGPTVGDFGFYPYGERDTMLETPGLSCRPCGPHGGAHCPIGTFDCMKNITVERVVQAALAVSGTGGTITDRPEAAF